MKYKVIAKILDGIICANKSNITCFVDNSLEGHVNEFMNRRYDYPLEIGDILPRIATNNAETYWSYSRKEWDKMNEAFQKLK